MSKLLGADFDSDEWHERLRTFIYELDEEEKVVLDSDEDMVYLPSLYYSEQGLAKKLNWLLMQDKAEYPIDVVYRVIGELEEAFGVQFADEQRDARSHRCL